MEGVQASRDVAADGAPHWQRTLTAATITIGGSGFGFTFVIPFLPLFLAHDLHVTNQGQLAIWSGIAASGSGFATAAVAPVWGRLADRYGRRVMVLRATGVAGVMTVVLSVCQTPLEVAIARLLMGLGSGVNSASNALVASQAPRHRVAWALGLMSSALAIGTALGPFTGGVLGSFLAVRLVILIAGLLVLLSMLPMLLIARETVPAGRRPDPPPLRAALAAAGPGTGRAIRVLVGAQGLVQIAYGGAATLVTLRILAMHLPNPALVTGITFGLSGVATGAAGLLYSRLVARVGYRRWGMAAGALMAVAVAVMAVAPWLWLLIVAVVTGGLLYGGLTPTLASMLGLESPREVQASVFGWNGSAFSLGGAAGPICAGFLAAALGLQTGFAVAAVSGALLALLFARWMREPPVALRRSSG